MALLHRLATVAFALVAFAGCAAVDAGPDPTPASDGDLAALESAFWYCDYVATTHGVLAAPMAACQYATSELKARKFGGSHKALVAWWEENKSVEHERMVARVTGPSPPTPLPQAGEGR